MHSPSRLGSRTRAYRPMDAAASIFPVVHGVLGALVTLCCRLGRPFLGQFCISFNAGSSVVPFPGRASTGCLQLPGRCAGVILLSQTAPDYCSPIRNAARLSPRSAKPWMMSVSGRSVNLVRAMPLRAQWHALNVYRIAMNRDSSRWTPDPSL